MNIHQFLKVPVVLQETSSTQMFICCIKCSASHTMYQWIFNEYSILYYSRITTQYYKNFLNQDYLVWPWQNSLLSASAKYSHITSLYPNYNHLRIQNPRSYAILTATIFLQLHPSPSKGNIFVEPWMSMPCQRICASDVYILQLFFLFFISFFFVFVFPCCLTLFLWA